MAPAITGDSPPRLSTLSRQEYTRESLRFIRAFCDLMRTTLISSHLERLFRGFSRLAAAEEVQGLAAEMSMCCDPPHPGRSIITDRRSSHYVHAVLRGRGPRSLCIEAFPAVLRGRRPRSLCMEAFPSALGSRLPGSPLQRMAPFPSPYGAARRWYGARRIFPTEGRFKRAFLSKDNPVELTATLDFLITNRDWILRTWAKLDKERRAKYLIWGVTTSYGVALSCYGYFLKTYHGHIAKKARELAGSSAALSQINTQAQVKAEVNNMLEKRVSDNEKAIRKIQALMMKNNAAAQVGLYRFPVRPSSSTNLIKSVISGSAPPGFNPLTHLKVKPAVKPAAKPGVPRSRRAPASVGFGNEV